MSGTRTPVKCAAIAPVLINLADVTPESVNWLWPDRVAIGKLTLLTGDPGLGKSFVTLDMAARVSQGLSWPDCKGVTTEVGGVVLLSAEDGPADTIRPRLDSLGADLTRVNLLEAVRRPSSRSGWSTEEPSDDHFDLCEDLPQLASSIDQTPNCRLVIIDPISAYLGSTDSHRDAALRGVLSPLAKLAADYNVAVVVVSHLNKNSGGKAIYRSTGSIAFTATARSAWVVTKDSDDPRRRLMLSLKNNLAPAVMGLSYTIDKAPDAQGPVVIWGSDPVDLTADEVMSEDRLASSIDGVNEEAEWLREALAGSDEVPAAAILKQARENGFTDKAVRRAFKALDGIRCRRGFAAEGAWYWSLPRGADMPIDAIDSQPPQTGINGNNGNQRESMRSQTSIGGLTDVTQTTAR